MAKRILLVALGLTFTLTLAPTFVVADPIISAPFVTVNVGDTFSIPIWITDTVDLTSWQFDLGFDPAIVNANPVTEGPFLSSFGTTFFTEGVIDNGTGLISLVAASYVGSEPFPSGSGVLANVQFLALSPGVSPLTLSSVFLNWVGSDFDITNGQITVIGTAAVPEPATLILLASGLASLFGMQRLAKRGRRDEV